MKSSHYILRGTKPIGPSPTRPELWVAECCAAVSVQQMSPSPAAKQRVSFTHYTRSKWSGEGSFKP
ncbi:hypothetical protein EYF80_008896 [Liparis tanakae]|uniref:Uncharacterized protein n=1 Tax=Liparis tanakae TaxID=230148 RepID=A0A4Z2IST6_9TELE|nr:hypothetical protein EYF80_008896 [Liparis tanakae]